MPRRLSFLSFQSFSRVPLYIHQQLANCRFLRIISAVCVIHDRQCPHCNELTNNRSHLESFSELKALRTNTKTTTNIEQLIMFSRIIKPNAFRARHATKALQQFRGLATVESTSAGRVMPASKAKPTPIAHDRATLTIRVCQLDKGQGAVLIRCRMDQFSTEGLSEPSPMSLERPSSRPPWSATQNQ